MLSAIPPFSAGWIDTPYAITAARLPKTEPGDYVVFVEEDGREKVLMYTLSLP